MRRTFSPSAFRRSQPGRADLIEALASGDNDRFTYTASQLGFEKQPEKRDPPTEKKGEMPFQGVPGESLTTPSQEKRQREASFWYLHSHHRREIQEADREQPEWFRRAKPLSATDASPNPTHRVPDKEPLVPWSRLWPFLRQALGGMQPTREPDLPQLVRRIGRGHALHRIPYRHKPAWAPRCQLIIDISQRLIPYWSDFGALERKLKRLRGKSGLHIHDLDSSPSTKQLPPQGLPLLILSDLGQYDSSGVAQTGWLRFGHQLRARGITPLVLTPTPRRCWSKALASLYIQVVWDHSVPLPGKLPRISRAMGRGIDPAQSGPDNLLDLLAPAIRVEPRLLRAARHLLPAAQADVGAEAELWQHPSVLPALSGFAYDEQAVNDHRERHRLLDSEQKQRVVALLESYHGALPPIISAAEMGYCKALGAEVAPCHERYMQRFVKSVIQNPGDQGLAGYVERSVVRHHRALWEGGEPLMEAAWVAVSETAKQRGITLHKPVDLNPQSTLWMREGNRSRPLQLWQRGGRLTIDHVPEPPIPASASRGSPIATFRAGDFLYSQMEAGQSGIETSKEIDLEQLPCTLPLPPTGRMGLRSDSDQLIVEVGHRPSWASAMGRDRYGLYAEFELAGVIQRMRWINPGEFSIGSPGSEVERSSSETQHKVKISRGYWLADSACTQALWEGVTGENPSQFKGAERPVERVSWKNIEKFIARVNRAHPHLALRLPTEAEWEYACRAGSKSPFAFGEQISSEQANYDGNYPYDNGEKGENRRETVEVKALPGGVNAWGLHQMHGNVWEW
ncbi:MAG: formylglycine-generating enzyme family protein, partial [Sedimenticola sp.]